MEIQLNFSHKSTTLLLITADILLQNNMQTSSYPLGGREPCCLETGTVLGLLGSGFHAGAGSCTDSDNSSFIRVCACEIRRL